jgi:putative hemolysin
MTDTFAPDDAAPDFTYSHPGMSRFRRGLIRAVELASGQPMLRGLYADWSSSAREEEDVFHAALNVLGITPQLEWQIPSVEVPKSGGLLLVANHPFGIVDGLALGHLGLRLRGNVQILTHSVLCQPAEIAPHLLPIDFSGTSQARRTSAQSRRAAIDLLEDGKVVAIFPAGGISTANKPVRGRAHDAEWHGFLSRLAMIQNVTTLPVYFQGQNSRLFQIASHMSYPLRVALIFNETRRLMNKRLGISLGAPISAEDLAALPRESVVPYLREKTMALGGAKDDVFVWPKHVNW